MDHPTTPKSSEPRPSGSKSSAFSPVTVSSSPASKVKQHGNLTGIPRNVRDSVADIYNLIQKWNKEHIDACLIISKITDTKKSEFTNDEKEDKYYESLQSLCDLLESSCYLMSDVVSEMKKIEKSLLGIQQLSEFKNGDDEAPIFLTWPISKFVDVVQLITSTYSAELETKRLVLRSIALTKNESDLVFFSSCWIHQPVISNANLTLKLEAALLETSLK